MAVRELMRALPDVEEVEAHGSPDFRTRGKTFATHAVNHHGDGRIALWLRMPEGAQTFYIENEPEHYFRPAYVGGKGWLGVNLTTGLRWSTLIERVLTAYATVAPDATASDLVVPSVDPPNAAIDPLDFDPVTAPDFQSAVAQLRTHCLSLPEVTEDRRFGDPVWRAGKKTFATAYGRKRRLYFSFWVGVENQPLYQGASDIHIPPYTGHNGWISIDASHQPRWSLIENLMLESYRHFALKRMLKSLASD
ncbi:MAG: MmcQ/YjbR family DNA-binding protein [Pseudomonadota bacterium]